MLLAFVGAALIGAGAAEAQQTIRLRYTPQAGRSVRTVSWTDLSMTFGDLPGAGEAATADTLRIDVEMVQSVTERVLNAEAGRFVVQRTIDSTRSRMRAMAGPWQDVPVDSAALPVARLVVSDRLQIEDFTLTRGDSAAPSAEWLRNPAGTFELTLPESAVAVGESWTTDLVFPLPGSGAALAQAGAEEVAAGAELVARVTVTLDSLVTRGTDTLAYTLVQGSFLPLMLSEAAEVAEGTASIRGAFGGTLIWSTGWDAWVSGAARAVLTVQIEMTGTEDAPAAGVEVRVNSETRFQVRP